MSPDGSLAATLDFEFTRIGDPLDDIAWWGWVVRYHHPPAWTWAWRSICQEADIDLDAEAPVLRALMLRELVRRVERATGATSHRDWTERLRSTLEW